MTGTRIPARFGWFPFLVLGCAPDPVEQSPSALLDDDVPNYAPADPSVGIRARAARPEVMQAPADILSIAEVEEGKTLDQVGVSTGFPLSTYAGAAAGGWCSEFVAWAYWRGGCPFTGQRGSYPWLIAGSTQIRQWFATNSRFVYQTDAEWSSYEPQPGDYIRYNSPEGGHSGIVRYADGATLYTIEGNVNSKVMRRTLRNYKTAYADPVNGIDGFGVMTAGQCTAMGGAGGVAGAGGRVGTDGAAGGDGTGGRGSGAGGTSDSGGVSGSRGSGGSAGRGGRVGTDGAAGGGSVGAGGAPGSAGAAGSAGTGGSGGAGRASDGTGGLSARGGSAGPAGLGGVPGTGGAVETGGTSGGGSISAGGSNSASGPVSSSGCSCATGRGANAGHGLSWLAGLAFLLAAGRRRRC